MNALILWNAPLHPSVNSNVMDIQETCPTDQGSKPGITILTPLAPNTVWQDKLPSNSPRQTLGAATHSDQMVIEAMSLQIQWQ